MVTAIYTREEGHTRGEHGNSMRGGGVNTRGEHGNSSIHCTLQYMYMYMYTHTLQVGLQSTEKGEERSK